MAQVVFSEQGGTDGLTIHGTHPNTVDLRNKTWTVFGGPLVRSGGRLISTNSSGFLGDAVYDTEYDVSATPTSNILLSATVNLGGVSGSGSGGVGFVVHRTDASNKIYVVLMDYFDGVNTQRGLKVIRFRPGLTNGQEVVAQSNFIPTNTADYILAVALQGASIAAVLRLAATNEVVASCSYTTPDTLTAFHGPTIRHAGGQMDNIVGTLDVAAMAVTSPVENQVIPVKGPGLVEIPVAYELSGGETGEASLLGVSSAYRGLGPAGTTVGRFHSAPGQGTLRVRSYETPGTYQEVLKTGPGFLIPVAACSNYVGQAAGTHTIVPPTGYPDLTASMAVKAYRGVNPWAPLADPTHANGGGAGDAVTNDSGQGASPLVPMARYIMELGIPVAFVCGAFAGSNTTHWAPPAKPFDTNTHLGSLMNRVRLLGGSTAWLLGWFETEAAAHRTYQQTYDGLDAIGQYIYDYTGSRSMLFGARQVSSNWYDANQRAVTLAAHQDVSTAAWCLGFLDFAGLAAPAGDGLHDNLAEQVQRAAIAGPWMRDRLQEVITPPVTGGGGVATAPRAGWSGGF